MPPSPIYEEISSGLIDPVTAQLFSTGLPNYYMHIISLLSPLRIHTQIINFAQLALQHLTSKTPAATKSDLLARLFHASLAISDFTTAYTSLARYEDTALQRAALSSLVTSMVAANHVEELIRLPFASLYSDVDNLLTEKARAELNTLHSQPGSIPYYKILYAFRLRRGDHRGAAAVIIERIEARRQRKSTQGPRFGGHKEAEKGLDEYLVGINALALVKEEDEQWVFVEGLNKGDKRRVVRLQDLRERYQEEIDRIGMIEMGRFSIVGDDDEGEDVDMG